MRKINPFSIVKANEFTNDQILENWVDFVEIEDRGFISSLNPKELMPKYVLGSKGCGKTHILLYYSFDARLLYYNNNITELLKKDGYIASYWRLDGLSSTRFNKRIENNEEWKDLFNYYFEIHQCIIALKLYKRIIDGLDIKYTIIKDIIKEITQQVGIILKEYTFEEFISLLNDRRISIDKEIIDFSHTRKLNWKNVKPLFPYGSLIFEIPKKFSEHVNQLKKVNYIFVLDELEKLRVDWQKESINTLVFEKKNNCTFWVGARKNGYTTRNTMSGEPLHDGHEFASVDLDGLLRQDEKAFERFAINLFNKRLKIYHLDDEPINPYNLFESFKENMLIEKLNNKDLAHWKKLKTKLKKIGLVDVQIERLIHALFYQVEDNPLGQKLKLYLFYKAWSKKKNNITIDTLENAAVNVNKQYSSFINGHNKTVKEFYGKFKLDFLSQLAEENNEDLLLYTGFKNLVAISDCNPRVYLTLLKKIVDDSIFRGNNPFESGNIVSMKSQYVGINGTAKWFLNDIEVYGKDKENLDIAMSNLLNFFYVSRYCDKPTESSLCSFYFRKKTGQDAVNYIIKLALNESFLIEVDNPRKDKTLTVPQRTFQINRIVASLYNLPISRRGIVSIQPDMMMAIFDSSHFDKYNSLLFSHRCSLNAPFKQDPLKILEEVKENWPSLFDNI